MPNRKACFGEFELDLVRFELRRNGQAVRLEGRPLQLLIFLVEHSCQLVTREQIADALWGKDVFVDVETGINTAIRKVRVALEDDSTQPRYLQTVVGRGYRFVAELDGSEVAAPEGFSISAEEFGRRSEEHTSELQSPCNLVCRLLLEKKKTKYYSITFESERALVTTRFVGLRLGDALRTQRSRRAPRRCVYESLCLYGHTWLPLPTRP